MRCGFTDFKLNTSVVASLHQKTMYKTHCATLPWFTQGHCSIDLMHFCIFYCVVVQHISDDCSFIDHKEKTSRVGMDRAKFRCPQ